MVKVTRTEAYKLATDSLRGLLGEGVVPWSKTWKGSLLSHGPCSVSTGEPLGGFGPIILPQRGYKDRQWGEKEELAQIGGRIRIGEDPTAIVSWKLPEVEKREPGGKFRVPNLSLLQLFNVEQADWGRDSRPRVNEEGVQAQPIPVQGAQRVIDAYLARDDAPSMKFNESGRAFYAPIADCINMPEPGFFDRIEDYYATFLHEIGHSTGAEVRLGRSAIVDFPKGPLDYCPEELTAEFTAYYLCAFVGMQDARKSSAARMAHWSCALGGYQRVMVWAVIQAQQAVNFILGSRLIK